MSSANRKETRLRAISLLSWSVEQNARHANGHARNWWRETGSKSTKKGSLSFFFSGCRPRFARLAASSLPPRALLSLNLKKKRDCSQSIKKPKRSFLFRNQLSLFHFLCWWFFLFSLCFNSVKKLGVLEWKISRSFLWQSRELMLSSVCTQIDYTVKPVLSGHPWGML